MSVLIRLKEIEMAVSGNLTALLPWRRRFSMTSRNRKA